VHLPGSSAKATAAGTGAATESAAATTTARVGTAATASTTAIGGAAGGTTGRAAGRRIGETARGIELLLSLSPNKVDTAFAAPQGLVYGHAPKSSVRRIPGAK